MRATTYRCYGPPAVLTLETMAKSSPADDQVLVQVHAAGVNPLDWHYLRGEPYLMRASSGLGAPTDIRMGVDFAGTVAAVGKSVTQFRVGDEVFGGASGAFGEYVTVRESRALTIKPANVSFEQAAAVPIAAITALQALRDKGELKPGQKVLINGASGGVGTFAVQIAKALGAEVTGVCSTRNVELVRSLGADFVVDYTREDFTRADKRYDVIIDNVGSHGLLAYRRALQPNGILVLVGSNSRGKWLGPLIRPLQAFVLAPFIGQHLRPLLAEMQPADLAVIAAWMEQGVVRSVIDRRYSLAEVPEAIEYLETGRVRGKLVITVLRESSALALDENAGSGATQASRLSSRSSASGRRTTSSSTT
ncbi:MAG: NAD(P)-dependent alcohol dehydrogenase [Proteobacteria bacterium]|nr:NAD(P)-dependent alcohol dehydrogenase [Pseudomonadota bacterium]